MDSIGRIAGLDIFEKERKELLERRERGKERERGRGIRRIFLSKRYPFCDITFIGNYFRVFYIEDGDKTLTGVAISSKYDDREFQIQVIDNMRSLQAILCINKNDYVHIIEKLKEQNVDIEKLKDLRVTIRKESTENSWEKEYIVKLLERNEEVGSDVEGLDEDYGSSKIIEYSGPVGIMERKGAAVTELIDAEYEEVVKIGFGLMKKNPQWDSKHLGEELESGFLKLNKTIDPVILEAALSEIEEKITAEEFGEDP